MSNCSSWAEQMSTLVVREGIGKSLRKLSLVRSQGRHVLSYSMRPTLLVDVLSVDLTVEHVPFMQLKLVSRALERGYIMLRGHRHIWKERMGQLRRLGAL